MDTRTLQALPIEHAATLTSPAAVERRVPSVVGVPGRAALFLAGLLVAGGGVAALLAADLGAGPADVMIGAMAAQIGVSHGTAAQALSAAFIAVAMVLGRRPGPGTVATAALFGPAINLGLGMMTVPASMPGRTLLALAGVAGMGLGVGLAIGARFGPSTIELWADAVSTRIGASKQAVRLSLEATLLVLGVVMGGPVGAVTIICGLAIGPLINAGTAIAHRVTGATARQWERSTRRLSRL